MGLFSSKPVEVIEGVVDRIGITWFTDISQTYTVLLRDGRSFEIDTTVGAAKRSRVNPELAMAKPGDSVHFGVKQGQSIGAGHFRNLTMRPGPTTRPA